MNGSVGRLSRNKLVERVPCYALDIVRTHLAVLRLQMYLAGLNKALEIPLLLPRLLPRLQGRQCPPKLGDEASNGLTAGNGRDGAGDADRRIEGDEPVPSRSQQSTGNSIAIASPAPSTPGTPMASNLPMDLAGRSILSTFPCGVNVNCPSLVFKV
jgi:hypothetical protein